MNGIVRAVWQTGGKLFGIRAGVEVRIGRQPTVSGSIQNRPGAGQSRRQLASSSPQAQVTSGPRWPHRRFKKHHKKKSFFRARPQAQVNIECKYCHGLGFRAQGACPICKGAKIISVPLNSVECGVCHGLAFTAKGPCTTCRGTSRVLIRRF